MATSSSESMEDLYERTNDEDEYYSSNTNNGGSQEDSEDQDYLGEEEECEELIASIFGYSYSAPASKNGTQVLSGGTLQHAICTPRLKEEPTMSRHYTLGEGSQPHNLQPLPTCFNNRVEQDLQHSSILQPQLGAVKPQQTAVQHNHKMEGVNYHEGGEDVILRRSTRCKRKQGMLEAEAFFDEASHSSGYNNSDIDSSCSERSYNRSWRSEEDTSDESSVHNEDLCKKKGVQIRTATKRRTTSTKKR